MLGPAHSWEIGQRLVSGTFGEKALAHRKRAGVEQLAPAERGVVPPQLPGDVMRGVAEGPRDKSTLRVARAIVKPGVRLEMFWNGLRKVA